jgi:hypothetical protein
MASVARSTSNDVAAGRSSTTYSYYDGELYRLTARRFEIYDWFVGRWRRANPATGYYPPYDTWLHLRTITEAEAMALIDEHASRTNWTSGTPD